MNDILNQCFQYFSLKSLLICLFWTFFGHFSCSTSINDSLTIESNYCLNWITRIYVELNNSVYLILGKSNTLLNNLSKFKLWIESDRVSQRATGQFPASRYSHAHNPDGISWRKTTASLDIIGLWMHLYLWCWGFPYGSASIAKICGSAELLLHSNSPHHLRWRQNLRQWECFHWIGVTLLDKYRCIVGILRILFCHWKGMGAQAPPFNCDCLGSWFNFSGEIWNKKKEREVVAA